MTDFSSMYGGNSSKEETERGALKSSDVVDEFIRRIAVIENKLNRIALISEVQWEILKQVTSFTDEQLTDRIESLVQEKENNAKTKVTCPKCSQRTFEKNRKCIYCGMDLNVQKKVNPFDI